MFLVDWYSNQLLSSCGAWIGTQPWTRSFLWSICYHGSVLYLYHWRKTKFRRHSRDSTIVWRWAISVFIEAQKRLLFWVCRYGSVWPQRSCQMIIDTGLSASKEIQQQVLCADLCFNSAEKVRYTSHYLASIILFPGSLYSLTIV